MDWTAQVDAYCERLGPGFWAEPINAVTNAAFLLAALVMALRLRGHGLPIANLLVGSLAAIGIGSFLFHTFATRWAGLADTLPILMFALVYVFAASREYLRLSLVRAILVVVALFPFAALLMPLLGRLPLFGTSAGYVPILLYIAIFAAITRGPVARGLWIAVALLTASLTFRSLDMQTCSEFPLGTHFLWHILNAVLLGWMIEVYRRAALRRLADQPRGG